MVHIVFIMENQSGPSIIIIIILGAYAVQIIIMFEILIIIAEVLYGKIWDSSYHY